MLRAAEALDRYGRRRQAKECNGIDLSRHDSQGLGPAVNGHATASSRRAEKSNGMALRCMGSDARQVPSNDTGSNGRAGR